jgi:hypothetical protein
MSKDCLDGTDEDLIVTEKNQTPMLLIKLHCIGLVTFLCEEKTCRQQQSFGCGDGECVYMLRTSLYISFTKSYCKGTGRDLYYDQAVYATAKYFSSDCYKFLFCTLNFYYFLTNDIYDDKTCLSDTWLLSNNCSIEFLSFPPIFAMEIKRLFPLILHKLSDLQA